MKILIKSPALHSEDENLLPAGALSGMKYLTENGAELSFDTGKLTASQEKLITNEGIEPGGLNPELQMGLLTGQGNCNSSLITK